MAPKKPTTTVTKTITGMTIEHTDTQLTPMPNSGRPYVLESAEFEAFILAKRQAAAREIEDLDAEINRLHVETEARLDRRRDLMAIIIKADAALGITGERPAPKLVEKGAAE